MTDAQKQNIENLRRQGMGYKRIADTLGLSENTVKSFCKRNKLGGCATTAKCKQCGKPLEHTPKARPKTFCCNKCRYDYWNSNPKQRQSARQIVCAGCGEVFAGVGSNRKYCGHPCYISSRFRMGGITNDAIARYLTNEGIPTPGGKEKWSVSTVMSILQNEKYKGDALLQKGYTVDFLTKKKKKNMGEVPQYYVANSHPAIVTPEVYELVQVELKKRKATGTTQSGLHPFSSRIKCGTCGSFYGPKLLHSNTKYRRTVWRCNSKYKQGNNCQSSHLYEAAIQKAFVGAFNQLYGHREQLLEDYAIIISLLTDTAALEEEAASLQGECDITLELIRKGVDENTRTASNQSEYRRRYTALVTRYEAANKRLGEVAVERQNRAAKRETITRFMDDMKRIGGPLAEFDEGLWCEMVEVVTVNSEKDVAFSFRDGSTIHMDARM